MISLSAARETAAQHGWLPRTDAAFARTFLEHCVLLLLAPGDTACRVGDPPGGMFGLVRGNLGAIISRAERSPYVAHFPRPGTWFGEACAITGQPRRVGLVAVRETALLYIPLPRILELLAARPEWWRYLALVTLEHADTATLAGVDLLQREPERRIAAVLLRLTGCRVGLLEPGDGPWQAVVSQEDVALFSNVTRNTVGAVLKDMSARGLVKIGYRSLEVLKPGALRAMLAE